MKTKKQMKEIFTYANSETVRGDISGDTQALIDMYNQTCKGCFFSEPEQEIGKPYCNYPAKRYIANGVCEQKRDANRNPMK